MMINGESVLIVLSAGITILAINLLIVSLLSYWKFRSIKLLLISLVFLFFSIRGVVLSIYALLDRISDTTLFLWLSVFDVCILVMLYVTSLKR